MRVAESHGCDVHVVPSWDVLGGPGGPAPPPRGRFVVNVGDRGDMDRLLEHSDGIPSGDASGSPARPGPAGASVSIVLDDDLDLPGTVPLALAAVAVAGGSSLPVLSEGRTPVIFRAQSWDEIEALLFCPSDGYGIALPQAPRVLIAAGSDSGGGAGIQADLKACAANGAFGMTAITALTAQNTCCVSAVSPCDAPFFEQQMDACLGDLGADVVKTGMLGSTEVAEAVAARVVKHGPRLVVDPVMVTSTGQNLVELAEARRTAAALFPLATVITPNLPEASVLLTEVRASGDGPEAGGADSPGPPAYPEILTLEDMRTAARKLHEQYSPDAVLLKGGHTVNEGVGNTGARGEGEEVVDILFDGEVFVELCGPYVKTRNSHGTGCTLGSTIAAHLARGCGTLGAAFAAKRYVSGALAASAGLRLGRGPSGPMNHCFGTNPFPVRACDLIAGLTCGAPGRRWRRPLDVTLYAVTDPAMNKAAGRTLAEAARAAAEGGARVVQLRDKALGTRDFVRAAREAIAAVRATGRPVPVLINDRVDVALAAGADGVHLGQDDMECGQARKLLGPGAIVGVSVKTPALARLAEAAGADYVGSGAAFCTSTKASSAIGVEGIQACSAAVSVPCVAIGGLSRANCAAVKRALRPRDGAAFASALFGPEVADVRAAAAALLRELGGGRA